MTIFSKIKKILENENACLISKSEKPLYVVMRWERYQEMTGKLSSLTGIEDRLMEEENELSDIDINKIPV